MNTLTSPDSHLVDHQGTITRAVEDTAFQGLVENFHRDVGDTVDTYSSAVLASSENETSAPESSNESQATAEKATFAEASFRAKIGRIATRAVERLYGVVSGSPVDTASTLENVAPTSLQEVQPPRHTTRVEAVSESRERFNTQAFRARLRRFGDAAISSVFGIPPSSHEYYTSANPEKRQYEE